MGSLALRSLPFVLLAFALVAQPTAQTPRVLLAAGDGLPGGAFQDARALDVDDAGHVFAVVEVHAGPGVVRQRLVRDRELLLAEGQPMPGVAGATLERILAVDADAVGNHAELVQLRLSPSLPVVNALYWNGGALLARQDEEVPGLPGLFLESLGSVVRIDAQGSALFVANLREGPFSGAGQALLRVRHQAGTVSAREVLAHTGGIPLAGSFPVGGILNFDLNERDEWAAAVSLVTGSLGTFGAVLVDGVQLAPDLAFGVDLSDLGGVAYASAGMVARPDELVLQGQVLARGGDVLPELAPDALTTISGARVSSSGSVLWTARTDGDPSRDEALVRGQRVILQQGVSQVGGHVVEALRPLGAELYALSPSGRFLVTQVRLQGTGVALLQLDFGSSVPSQGCRLKTRTLRVRDELVLAGGHSTFELAGAQLQFLSGLLVFALAPAPLSGTGCGVLTPFGELLIDPRQHLASLAMGTSVAGEPIVLDLLVPPDVALIGTRVFAQAASVYPPPPFTSLELSNALELVVGAP